MFPGYGVHWSRIGNAEEKEPDKGFADNQRHCASMQSQQHYLLPGRHVRIPSANYNTTSRWSDLWLYSYAVRTPALLIDGTFVKTKSTLLYHESSDFATRSLPQVGRNKRDLKVLCILHMWHTYGAQPQRPGLVFTHYACHQLLITRSFLLERGF